MQENQLFSKPIVPNKGISKIYPKSDGFWYYMNYDGIEVKLGEGGTISWGDIEGDINNQVDLINLINNISSSDIDGGVSNTIYIENINLGGSLFEGGQSLDGGLSF